MKAVRCFCAVALVAALASPAALGQEPAKPGPEHAMLQKREGTWALTMKAQGMEFKGSTTYKMELGGLWLVGAMESDFGGLKYTGKSLETYDAGKKKFVTVWADSMGTQPMLFEGGFDADKKTLTMIADGPGPDGKPTKWKSVTTFPDADTCNFGMYLGDGKEPMFTVVYKRKK